MIDMRMYIRIMRESSILIGSENTKKDTVKKVTQKSFWCKTSLNSMIIETMTSWVL